MNGNVVIEIKNGSVGYGGKLLQQGLNFSIMQGEVVALLGLNGAGKSSLLRIMAGLQKLNAGEIFLQGKLYQEIGHDEMAKAMTIVLTGRGEVIPALSVMEILTIARSPFTGWMHTLNDKDKMLIDAVVQQLNIGHLLKRKLFQLSDGEAQKVFIAKALIQEAPVILLDEPTAHLDIANKLEIFSLIRQLSAGGKTIIIATHELDLALQIADSCLLLDQTGKYVFGKTKQLIADHAVRAFFNSPHFQFNEATEKFDIQL